MVTSKGVKANLVRYEGHEPYAEYLLPRGALKHPDKEELVFVEAVTGERFGIIVELLPGFDFKSKPAVEVAYSIDGSDGFTDHLSAEDAKRPTAVIGDRRCEAWTTGRLIHGKWWNCSFFFAELRVGTLTFATTCVGRD